MNYLPKAILFLLICAAAAFFVKREDDRGGLAKANRTYVDWLIGNSKEQIRTPSVTLLTIDDSEEPIFQSWPPGPIDYSIMLRRLARYAPKVVAVEPVLQWQETAPGELEILRTAGLAFDPGQLLLGTVLQWNTGAPEPKGSTLNLLRPLPSVTGDLEKIPEFSTVSQLPDPRLTAVGASAGFTQIDLGEGAIGGSSLLVPLLARVGDIVVPSFVLLAAMLELDATAADVEVLLGESITIKGDLVIPIDPSGALNVFAGLRATLPVRDANILVWDPTDEGGGAGGGLGKTEREALASRVVLLGMDDENARTIPAGRGEKISRAELFALAIATIQSGRYLEKVSPAVEWIAWAVLVGIGLLLLRLHRKRAFGLALLLVLLYVITNLLFFQSAQSWLPPAVPLALLACVILGALTLSEGREAP